MRQPNTSAQRVQVPDPTDRYTAVTRVLTDQQHVLRLKPRWVQLVLHLLARKWYADSPVIPSVPTLAREMACSDRTVQRAADGLVGVGILTVERRRRSDGGYTSNEYHLAPWLLAVVAPRGDRDGTTMSPSRHHPGDSRGGRTTRYSNQQNRTTQNGTRYTPPASAKDLLMTSRGYSLRR